MQTNVSVTADPAAETTMKKRNTLTIGDQLKSYARHPGAGVLAFLTLLGAVITFALLFFLIGYVLVKGIPYLNASLFSLTYTSENVSLLPSLINTLIMTLVSLAIAAPVGIFAAIFLVEYAKRGNKFVEVIRLTTETLQGIPSIVYGLFGMLFFVTTCGWGFSILAGAFTLAIMVLPLIMRSTEEALKAGFIQRRKLWTWCRKTPYRIPHRTSVSGTGNPGRCDPGDRTNRRRDSSADLYSGNRCKGTK